MQGEEETLRTNVVRQDEKFALYPQEVQRITETHRAIMTPKKIETRMQKSTENKQKGTNHEYIAHMPKRR